jgi:hypothetical protein
MAILYNDVSLIFYSMKKLLIISIMLALFASGTALKAQEKQEYLGLPGDNLNLYAVMNLFQQSKTLEDFEKSLNDENSTINNLDLNGDNQVDYIRVIDNVDGNVHNIVLQDAVSPTENQDVAVFTVQRFNNGQVQIQLTGDEDLYGKNYIIEPRIDNASETANPGYTGRDITYVTTTPDEIAVWPVVRFIYLPTYTRWHSSWYWGYYPEYWHPWHPFSWNYYYGYQSNWNRVYYSHYRPWQTHRYTGWNDNYYRTNRAYSPEVNHRITAGVYKTTYSHPDQRKEGEERFAKNHPDQYRSVHSDNNSISNRRETNSTMSNRPERPGTNNNSSHPGTMRTTTTVANRSVTNAGRPNGNPSTSVNHNGNNASNNNHTATNPTVNHPGNNSNNNHAVTNSVNTNPTVKRDVSTNRTVTNRVTTNPQQTTRTTTQTKNTTVNSSKGRMKQESKPAAKKENKPNESDNKGPDRR